MSAASARPALGRCQSTERDETQSCPPAAFVFQKESFHRCSPPYLCQLGIFQTWSDHCPVLSCPEMGPKWGETLPPPPFPGGRGLTADEAPALPSLHCGGEIFFQKVIGSEQRINQLR